MLGFCRFCVRWKEPAEEVDKFCIKNLLAKDAIKRMFNLEIDCSVEIFPAQACHECILALEKSYSFYEQLSNAKLVLCEELKTGKLQERLEEIRNQANPLYVVESENDNRVEQMNDSGTIMTCGFEEERWIDNMVEKVIEIKIEATEELEIVSTPLVRDTITQDQNDQITLSHGSLETFDEGESSLSANTNSYDYGQSKDHQLQFPKQKADDFRSPSKETLELKGGDFKNTQYKCFICNRVYKTKAILLSHLISHDAMLPYNCHECSTYDKIIQIRTVLKLNKHLESHSYLFICHECPLRYRTQASLYEHMHHVHSIMGSYTCELCGTRFEELRKYNKHMNAHRNKQTKRYRCGTCSKTFQTGSLLKRHELTHSKDTRFDCSECGHKFNHESNFITHKMRHLQHKDKLSCSVGCDLQFTNYVDWQRHMECHFPDDARFKKKEDILPQVYHDPSKYPQQCLEPGCNYTAKSYHLMWAHYRCHYKSFSCQQCDKNFSNPSSLRIHVSVKHMKIRQFSCEVCGKQFAYRHKLQEHLNVHKRLKNLKCLYCSKMFLHSSNLAVHHRVHTGEKPYQCSRCGKQFISSSSLSKHEQNYRKLNGSHQSTCMKYQMRQQTGSQS